MTSYKVRVPAGFDPSTGGYKVRVPAGFDPATGGYNILVPSTTEWIQIDMTGAPAGASWTLRNSVPEIVATGSSGTGQVQYPFETYTLTWEDTAYPWIPPSPEGPTVLSAGNPITFGPP